MYLLQGLSDDDTFQSNCEIYLREEQGHSDLGFNHMTFLARLSLGPFAAKPLGSEWNFLDFAIFTLSINRATHDMVITTTNELDYDGLPSSESINL